MREMPELDRGRSIGKHRHYSPEREVEAEDESLSFGDRGGYHGHRERERERGGSRSGSKSGRRRRHHHHREESPSRSSKHRRHKTPVDTWLGENGMKEYREAFYEQGFDELIDVFFCAMCDPIFRTIVPKRGHQLKLQRQLSLYFSPQQLQMMNAQGGANFPSSNEIEGEQPPPGFPQPPNQQPSPFYQPFSPPMPPGPPTGWGGGDSPSPMGNRGGGESPPTLPTRGGRGTPGMPPPRGYAAGTPVPPPPLYPTQGRGPPQQPSFGSYEGESPSYPGGPHFPQPEQRGRTRPLHGRPPTPTQGPGGRGRRNSGFSSVGGQRRPSPSPVDRMDEYPPSLNMHQMDFVEGTVTHGRRHSYHSQTPPPGQTSRRGSTTVHHHPFQPEPQAPARSSTPTQRLSWFPGASGPSPDLQTVFLYFCKFGDKENPGRMNSFKWAKLLRELRLIDGNLNIQEADIIFHKVKPMKAKTVDYDEFCEAIPFLAATKYPHMDPDRAIDHFLRALNENL